MIAETGVELDTLVEERLVRRLELLGEILRPFGSVDVVAHHHDDRKLEPRIPGQHLLPDLVLLLFAVAVVADDREVE